ncbi:transposase [Sporosarcina pasteurii]|uniref:Uncharacterized protein n=1 Tax=Sporosarcina pasteurii TaxID=1474 RepID=A0A380CA73_SPOPA|nr:transposase [Sporosarcina pasteurii]MDS9472959.1 transposase [Sporosarcina pasteurii]SUJ14608.1 Uncharacterised protein [Sporosarcina pasteurii]
MPKRKLYISVTDQRVYHYPDDAPWEFEIAVEPEFVPIFRRLFEQVNRLERRNFLRSHLPYVPYHYDSDNHDIDLRTKKVYAIIHEFSDKPTKRFIEQLPYFR